MKRTMQITSIFFLFVCTFFYSTHIVEAKEHTLNELHIHTYLHDDGSATITEIRQANLSKGTENFDIIENLGTSTITDFTVKEAGKTYEYIDNWNMKASREEKSFKNSMIETAKGYELVWGIGEYGKHTYELQYKVTDFIKQTKSGEQILFWRYVNDETNIPPEEVTIEVEADYPLSEEDERIWGFGFKGDIHFIDGKVIATSDAPFKNDNYATVLVAFAENTFQTSDILAQTFDEVKDKAFEESDYQQSKSPISPLAKSLIAHSIPLIIAIILFLLIRLGNPTARRRRKYKGEYEREIPFDGPFSDFYYLLLQMKTTKLEHLLSAFILKWLKEDYIEMRDETVGLIFKVDQPVIYLLKKNMDKVDLESELFDMFVAAENEDEKVDQHDFSAWVKNNRSKMRNWNKNMQKQSLDRLNELGVYRTRKRKFPFIKKEKHNLTDVGMELKETIFQYMTYLEDYSLLNEHDAINVKLWDEIMIWAAILGITEEVYKQFSSLYPAYANESIYTHSMISTSHSYGKAISSASSYVNSGGGGSTSSGGGGGSFGGGSGGGTR